MHCYMTILLQLQEPNQPFDGDTVPYFHVQPTWKIMIRLILFSVIEIIDESFIPRKQMYLH